MIVDRIIKEKSYQDLAAEYSTTPQKIKEIFEAILYKIDRNISYEVAKHLRIINAKLNARLEKPFSVVEFS